MHLSYHVNIFSAWHVVQGESSSGQQEAEGVDRGWDTDQGQVILQAVSSSKERNPQGSQQSSEKCARREQEVAANLSRNFDTIALLAET